MRPHDVRQMNACLLVLLTTNHFPCPYSIVAAPCHQVQRICERGAVAKDIFNDLNQLVVPVKKRLVETRLRSPYYQQTDEDQPCTLTIRCIRGFAAGCKVLWADKVPTCPQTIRAQNRTPASEVQDLERSIVVNCSNIAPDTYL
jgi:hypothetical protein